MQFKALSLLALLAGLAAASPVPKPQVGGQPEVPRALSANGVATFSDILGNLLRGGANCVVAVTSNLGALSGNGVAVTTLGEIVGKDVDRIVADNSNLDALSALSDGVATTIGEIVGKAVDRTVAENLNLGALSANGVARLATTLGEIGGKVVDRIVAENSNFGALSANGVATTLRKIVENAILGVTKNLLPDVSRCIAKLNF